MAVDVNEYNVTLVVYENARLIYPECVETDLSRITIAYAEKHRRIMKGRHWSDRIVRKRLKRLVRRERNKKPEILRKTARRIVELAQRHNAAVVVGNISRHKREILERQEWSTLRHRLHQWSSATLA